MASGVYKRIIPPWNKGIKTGANPAQSERMKGRTPWNKGLKGWTVGTKAGFQQGHGSFAGAEKTWFPKGVVPKTAFKVGDERISGKNNNFWKGGVTPENHKIRNSVPMKNWRKAVFERDDFTCQICEKRGCELNADHIKPFAYFPELRFELSNGRTLCVDCHKATPNYMNRWVTKEQYQNV